MEEVAMYVDGKYMGKMYTNCIPVITAEPGPVTSIEDDDETRSLLPTVITFTGTFKVSKAWRRIGVCKSRKRFIKLLMSKGYDRNTANRIAEEARALYSYNPYLRYWRYINNIRIKENTK